MKVTRGRFIHLYSPIYPHRERDGCAYKTFYVEHMKYRNGTPSPFLVHQNRGQPKYALFAKIKW